MSEQTPYQGVDNDGRDPDLSALYRRISTETTPPELDESVLRYATARQPTASRWRPALAMAASVVVAVGVGRTLLNDETALIASAPEPRTESVATESTDADESIAPAATVQRASNTVAVRQEITADDLRGANDARPTPQQLRLDSAVERSGAVQQLNEAAREREADIDRGAFSDALDAPAMHAARLKAPPDPALAALLREVDFASLSNGPCDTEVASAGRLTECWRAARELGDQRAAGELEAAIKRRLPSADWPEELAK
ncbi:MAG: hypothetical protein AAGC71_03460 [Pseudomonadota bacterium]